MSAPNGTANGKARTRIDWGKQALPGYTPRPNWWSYGSAALDGMPVFTWMDVPRMVRDEQVQLGLRMLRAPIQQVRWRVGATNSGVKQFVDVTLRRFWERGQPRVLQRYLSWGRAPLVSTFAAERGLWRWHKPVAVEVSDCTPLVWAGGEHKGQFAGFKVRTDDGDKTVGAPHAFWFDGWAELGQLCDRPRLAGAFRPWLEKNGRNGAVQQRTLWARKATFTGGMLRHPAEADEDIGTPETADVRHPQDIARETVEYYEAGSSLTLPNTPNRQDPSKYAWEWTPPESQGDNPGVRQYPKDLDQEILTGLGIPPEVIEAMETGSGWSGRLIPALSYFGSCDELAGLLIQAFDEQVLRPLVRENFGDARYEIDPLPLAETLLSGKGGQGGGGPGQGKPDGQNPPKPGGHPGGHWKFDPRTGQPRDQQGGANLSHEGGDASAPDPEHLKVLRLAMVTAAHLAAVHGHDAQPQLDALADLAHDPEGLASILGAADLAWVPYHGPRGGVGAKSDDTGRVIYGERARAALAAQQRREGRQSSAKKARELASRIFDDTLGPEGSSPSHFEELATHLPALTARELRDVRWKLRASFKGRRRRDEMLGALLKHAGERAAGGAKAEPAAAEKAPASGAVAVRGGGDVTAFGGAFDAFQGDAVQASRAERDTLKRARDQFQSLLSGVEPDRRPVPPAEKLGVPGFDPSDPVHRRAFDQFADALARHQPGINPSSDPLNLARAHLETVTGDTSGALSAGNPRELRSLAARVLGVKADLEAADRPATPPPAPPTPAPPATAADGPSGGLPGGDGDLKELDTPTLQARHGELERRVQATKQRLVAAHNSGDRRQAADLMDEARRLFAERQSVEHELYGIQYRAGEPFRGGRGDRGQTPAPPADPLAAVKAEQGAATGKGKELLSVALHNATPPDGSASDPARLAKSLANAWADASRSGYSPPDLAPAERALAALGAKPIGVAGSTVPFDGATHQADTPVSTGSPVRVTRPGWLVPGPHGDLLAQPAKVEPAAGAPPRKSRAERDAEEKRGWDARRQMAHRVPEGDPVPFRAAPADAELHEPPPPPAEPVKLPPPPAEPGSPQHLANMFTHPELLGEGEAARAGEMAAKLTAPQLKQALALMGMPEAARGTKAELARRVADSVTSRYGTYVRRQIADRVPGTPPEA